MLTPFTRELPYTGALTEILLDRALPYVWSGLSRARTFSASRVLGRLAEGSSARFRGNISSKLL